MMEKLFGFRPPPDKVYNNLLAIRKIALKLRTNETVQYLNFDYFAKRNMEINDKWIKDRKGLLVKLLKSFETRLAKRTQILKQRLDKELDSLHAKRLKQFDQMNTKYLRCKNLLSQVNAREKIQFAKSKKHFHMRNDVPKLRLKRELSPPSRMEIMENTGAPSGIYNPEVMSRTNAKSIGTRTHKTGTRA